MATIFDGPVTLPDGSTIELVDNPPDPDNPKAHIWRLAKRHGFPKLRLCPWESVLPGEERWRMFLTYASAKDLERAEAALRALEVAA